MKLLAVIECNFHVGWRPSREESLQWNFRDLVSYEVKVEPTTICLVEAEDALYD